MLVPPRLSVVTLGVGDFAAMRAFYQALGWETRSTSEDFAAFPLGGAVLALYPVGALAGEARLPSPPLPQPFRGFSLAINVESEEAVDAAVEAVRRVGGRILAEPVGRDWGGRSAYFADPEGNVWEVAHVPGATFDERGALIWPW